MKHQGFGSLKSYANKIALGLSGEVEMNLGAAVSVIVSATKSNNRIWIIGNGGSAATASHFATDLMRVTKQRFYRVRAASLAESNSQITAIGNDFDYSEIFQRQIWNLCGAGDVLVTISASGNSQNLVKGCELAEEMGLRTIAIVGFDGGQLRKKSQLVIHCETKNGEYEVAEDCHSIVCHFIAMNVRQELDSDFFSSKEEQGGK